MFFKKKKVEGTTIFFCTDVHGSTMCFKKFLNAPRYYGSKGAPVNVMIVGGDITGKMMVPIIKEANGRYRSYLFGKEQLLKSEDELRELERKTEILGVYPYVFEPDEYATVKESPERRDELFRELTLARLREWVQLADERLEGSDVRCYMSPGNDDFDECVDVIRESATITCPDMEVVRIDDDHEMVNLGYANITPFDCPRDVPEEELTERLERMTARVENMENCVFNLHCPPIKSEIDEAPELDDELRPKMGTTGVIMAPAGSAAVRAGIEKHQPLLGLHGHIHESRGTNTLGRTLCLNPGSEYSEGILHGALVTINKGEVVTHLLTSG